VYKRQVLVSPFAVHGITPSENEFVETIATVILHDADVARTILPGAREQISKLVECGDKPAIWSAGYPEHQYRKLGKTGLIDSVAMAAFQPPIEISHGYGAPIEITTAIAPNKTTGATFARVREIAGDSQIIVVDDRIKNLQKFLDNMPEAKAAIWVQFGAHAEREMSKLKNGESPNLAEAIATGRIIPIDSIDRLADKVAELRERGVLSQEQASVFFDYDDTISNNSQRRAMELDAIVHTIFSQGWV
jgi:hypothetical protein